MSASLKKLWNNYGIGAIVVAIIVLYVIFMFYKYYAGKSSSGKEQMNSNNNSAYSNKSNSGYSNSGVKPSAPLGQNSTYANVNSKNNTSSQGLPSACKQPTIQNPSDLLPKDSNSDWAQLNPAGQGDLSNINLLKAGYHIGIDTIGQTLRNANLQIRSEPPNPQVNVGPWNLSTIEPDFMRPPLEVGQGNQ